MNKFFLVILSCICLIIYAGYLNNGFVFDDKILVEENPLIKSSHLLPDVFKTGIYDYWTGMQPYDRMFRPLQMLSYYLDYNLWGLNPAGFRFTNILLHLLNSILVFYLFILTFNRRLLAAATSLLFLVHPVQISSVAYISARADLLSVFFILSCCVLFLRFLNSKNRLLYFLSILAAALAFLSRENAFLIILFLILISILNRNKAKIRYLAAFFVLSAAYLLTRFIIFGPSGLNTHADYISGALSLVNFFNIAWRYALLLLWPINLHMFNSTAFINHSNIPALLLSIAGLILLVVAVLKWQKAKQLPAVVSFGLFWFLLGIIPVYFYFDAYPALGSALMAESWLYLPSIGFFAVFAYLCLFNKNGKLIIITCSVILGSLVMANRVYWRNDVTFYERALHFLPEDSIILRNLASAYIESGDLPKAYNTIKRLEEYYADTPVVNMVYGQYYFASGNPKEALNYYKRILSKSFFSNYSISLCYAKLGDFDKAIEFSLSAFSQNPFFEKNIIQLAGLYGKAGQKEQANRYLLLAKQLDPKREQALLE
ncbi:MAG: glycosyltransferase family 39 protein [Candidatus Omnitrophica bacterium]|nr:glycosyltransferase family 39 protein [Candidatus Omnitrophota bacterium]MDD5690948.1 glycosyltransferase family 39 protein [Candidatus Omnitrophota bacterium]